MFRFVTSATLALTLGLSACEYAPLPMTLSGQSRKIEALFKVDTLNARRSYIERMLGPAKYIDRGMYTYIVDDCRVKIYFENDSAKSLGIDNLSRKCSFQLDEFFPNRKLKSVYSITFGDLSGHFNSPSFFPGCIGGCGNYSDPYIYAIYEGNRSDDFLDIVVSNSYPYRGIDEGKGFSGLRSDIHSDAGCDPDVQKLARYAFATSQFKSINIGWDLYNNTQILIKKDCRSK